MCAKCYVPGGKHFSPGENVLGFNPPNWPKARILAFAHLKRLASRQAIELGGIKRDAAAHNKPQTKSFDFDQGEHKILFAQR